MYRVNLLEKIKIYPIQYIAILELVYRNIKPLVYKADIYKGQEEDKQEVLKIISYKDINNEIWYKVKWIGYNKTTQELLDNLKKRYKKGIGVLEENRLGSINKEGLLKNKSPKGDLKGAPAKVFGVVSLSIRRESILLLLSS